MKINYDCRHMRWDRPCVPHKKHGAHCDGCPHYEPVKERLLVVKLDALGDVLRTTCILPALKERYKSSHITWITMPEALPVLENNPYLNRVVGHGTDSLAMLAAEKFDMVFSLDAAVRTAALATIAKAGDKRGFGLDENGRVHPLNGEAEEWFVMGLFDDLKKENRRTYQEIVMDICGLKGMRQRIVLELKEKEIGFAGMFAGRAGLMEAKSGGFKVVGINTGSGLRWPMKQWSIEKTSALIKRLMGDKGLKVLLFGGEEESERNRKIMKMAGGGLTDTGCGNSVREFFSLLSLCDILVTSDTLALHASLGLGKKVVALFGPTSPQEIDVYGRGIKLAPETDCACCYLRECSVTPSCMEQIGVDEVYGAAGKLLQ